MMFRRICNLLLLLAASALHAQAPTRISWAIKYDPKTFDPALVDDPSSETLRFLTSGVLLRQNRLTLAIEPALAERYELTPDGRLLTLHLRRGLQFSDGSSLTAVDVLWSLNHVLSPATAAPVLQEFGGGPVTVDAPDPLTIRVHLSRRVVSILRVFDEIAIEPANRPSQARVTSGSFTLAEYKRGESVTLRRNPHYWRRDPQGRSLPYLDSLQIDILANPEQNELRFLRGQYQLLDSISADDFNALSRKAPGQFFDQGPSFNTEQLWFNQSPSAPIPGYEKAWFTSRNFRQAVSFALRRQDMVRIAFDGHATAANGFISPANTLWHDNALKPATQNSAAALNLLAADGFRRQGKTLVDRDGHPVRFTLLTNAGNRAREKIGVLIQGDLAALGIDVNLVTLDFPALGERLAHTQNYEAVLLGIGNVDPDPSSIENVWLSSSPDHQWNPSQKSPATPWEAELDRQTHAQSTAATYPERKRAVDAIQQIVSTELPFIYLVYPDALAAVSPRLDGVVLTPLQPRVLANIDLIRWKAGTR